MQFPVGAEYPGHLCDKLFAMKNPMPMITRLRKRRKRKQKEDSRIINCTAQIFAQAYKTRGIPGDQARTSVI